MKNILIIFFFIALFSCKNEQNKAEKDILRDLPKLNTTIRTTLKIVENGEIDQSCLYLTQYDEMHNFCVMYLDSDNSLASVISNSEISEFQLLETGSNHDISPINIVYPLGDRIETTSLEKNKEFILSKTTEISKIIMSFKIIKIIYDSSVQIEYQIKEYQIF
ncbi:MAG: hypothetical protein H6622_15215 [Halobacteriovoraceae bacterium]|nr:hypothetical protein [Halobacteriovoraceae bacterium]